MRAASVSWLFAIAFLPVNAWSVAPWPLLVNTNNVKLITDYGANAGNADNASFVQNAINAAATGGLTNGLRGGVVEVPSGTYLCGPLTMKNNVRLQLDVGATLQLLPYESYPTSPYTSSVPPFINATGLTNIAITGFGMIDGQGAPWWQAYSTNSSINRPVLINVSGSSKVLLQDFATTNSPVAHILAKGANAGSINFVRINLNSPASGAPNTDGIDFAETNALFQDCVIATGDDNIAIGSSASTSSDMLVTNCFFGAGHGLSIGSYTSGGVSNLTVINCSFDGSGIRIKSSRDRGGIVRNINYLNLTVTNSDTPINFYAYYEFGLGTLTALTPQFVANYCLTNANPSPYNPPIFRDILVSNFTATLTSNVRNPFLILGLPDHPVSNIVFQAMNFTKPGAVNDPQIYNATNVSFNDCNLVLPAGDAIQMWNADVAFTNSSLSTNMLILDGLTYSNIGNTLEFDNVQAVIANTNGIAGGGVTLNGSTLVISNSLALTTAMPLTFAVGTNPSLLAVKGNLNIGGLINVIAGSEFGYGSYMLITNTGTVSGALPLLGSVPAGYVCSLDTNTPKQLRLIVASLNAPLPPENLTAAGFNGTVALQWSPSASATSYNVKRATVSAGPFVTVTNISQTNYIDIGLVNGTAYYYVVSALNASAEGKDSGDATATPLCIAPPVPDCIVALAGNAQVSLIWDSAITATSYNVKRAPALAGPYATVATVTATNYTNIGLNNGTTCYYQISAGNDCGEGSNSPVLSATPVAPPANYHINSGGSAVGSFSADANYSGGGTYSSGNTIDTNGLINPAPASAYQSERNNNFSYTFAGLTPDLSYTVRLHFAELYWASAGARLFDVFINGSEVLTNFDIYSVAGAKNKAVIREFTNVANASGQITLQYSNVTDYAKSGAIEILNATSAPMIVSQPADQTVNAGSAATFTAVATGAPTPGYQWSRNGTILTGQTSSTLTLTNVESSDQGIYCAVASNSGGAASSRNATLTVVPVVNATPINLFVTVGNGSLTLAWPADHVGWRLESQTNSPGIGLSTNWSTVAGSTATNQMIIPVNFMAGSAFFRMAYP